MESTIRFYMRSKLKEKFEDSEKEVYHKLAMIDFNKINHSQKKEKNYPQILDKEKITISEEKIKQLNESKKRFIENIFVENLGVYDIEVNICLKDEVIKYNLIENYLTLITIVKDFFHFEWKEIKLTITKIDGFFHVILDFESLQNLDHKDFKKNFLTIFSHKELSQIFKVTFSQKNGLSLTMESFYQEKNQDLTKEKPKEIPYRSFQDHAENAKTL
jgi:hypothetical protein